MPTAAAQPTAAAAASDGADHDVTSATAGTSSWECGKELQRLTPPPPQPSVAAPAGVKWWSLLQQLILLLEPLTCASGYINTNVKCEFTRLLHLNSSDGVFQLTRLVQTLQANSEWVLFTLVVAVAVQ